jgi:hypothetical protein
MAILCLVAQGLVSLTLVRAENMNPRKDAGTITDIVNVNVEGLKREIRCWNLINGLELSSSQAELILDRAQEVEKLRQQLRAEYASQQNELEKLLGEIQGHLAAQKEVPPAAAQQYHRLASEGKRAWQNMNDTIHGYAREIEGELEDHQKYALEKYIPCIIPPKGESRIGQAEDYRGLTRGLERIRALPYRIYQRRRGALVARAGDAMRLHLPRSAQVNKDELRERIGSVYDKARRMDDTEFEIKKEDLARELQELIKPPPRPQNQSLARKIEQFLLAPEVITILENLCHSQKHADE